MSPGDSFPAWCKAILREDATHYHVLGLQLFEEDQQLIREAVKRQAHLVWQHLMGPHARLARRARQRVDLAGRRLSNARSKTKYDESLRRSLELPEPTFASPSLGESGTVNAWISAADRETNRSLVVASCMLFALVAVAIGFMFAPSSRPTHDKPVREAIASRPTGGVQVPTATTSKALPKSDRTPIESSGGPPEGAVARETTAPAVVEPAIVAKPTLPEQHRDSSSKATTFRSDKQVRSSPPDLARPAEAIRPTPASPEPVSPLPRNIIPQSTDQPSVLGQSVPGIRSFSISADGRSLVTGAWDQTVRLWDLKSGKELRRYVGATDSVLDVALSEDSTLVAAGTADGAVLLWRLEDGQQPRRFDGHEGAVNAVAFSHRGEVLVTCGNDQTVRIWNLSTGDELRCRGKSRWTAVAVSFDDRWVLAGGRDGTLVLWDAQSATPGGEFKGHHSAVHSVAFVPGTRSLLSGSWDGTIRFWSLDSAKEERRLTGDSLCLALSRDGTQIATGSEGGQFKRWDLKTGHLIESVAAHQERVARVLFAGNTKSVVSVGWDDSVRLWQSEAAHKQRDDRPR